MKKSKKYLLLCFVFIFALHNIVPVMQVKAAANSISYTLKDGVLTISGTGNMPKYETYEDTPWYDVRFDVRELIIEDGITGISDYAFTSCYLLKTVTLPDSIKTIGLAAFCECEDIETVKLPANLQKIDTAAFADCFELKEIIWNNSLKEIGDYAFQYTAIKDMQIPEGVTKIGNYVFMDSSIETVTLPASATSIGCVGYTAQSLKSITVRTENKNYKSVDGVLLTADGKTLISYPANKEINSYTIPSTVKTLGDCSFSYANLDEVKIGNNVTTIKDWVFYGAKLKTVTLPSSITSCGDGPFDQCYDLVSADISGGIKQTPYRMFQDCKSLKTVTFHNGLESIYMRCMMNCDSMTKVILPSTVKKISNYAFYDCKNLETIILPNKLEYIGPAAFSGCSKLKLQIPKGLSKLENGAYTKAYNLRFTGTQKYDLAYEVLSLVNKERTKKGLQPLQMDKDLLNAAMKRAGEITFSFSHDRPDGTDCFTACKKMFGENIAIGPSSAKDVMKKWMNSDGHKANILNKDFKSIGIGCFYQDGNYMWVQCFGTGNAETIKKPSDKTKTETTQLLTNSKFSIYFYRDELRIGAGCSETRPVYLYMKSGWYSVKLNADNFIWSTSNGKIAKVDTKGKITGVSSGKATIRAALKENPSVSASIKVIVKSSTTYGSVNAVKGIMYKVTSSSTVKVTGCTNENTSKIKIPNTVKICGKTFKVTSIQGKAFYNCKKLTSVTIGSNVKVIGSKAFYNNPKLKTVTIRSTKVTSVGKDAFGKAASSLRIKVSPKYKAKLKKLLKKSGYKNKVI